MILLIFLKDGVEAGGLIGILRMQTVLREWGEEFLSALSEAGPELVQEKQYKCATELLHGQVYQT